MDFKQPEAMKKCSSIILLLASLCGAAFAASPVEELMEFVERVNVWTELDSLEMRSEYSRLETNAGAANSNDLDVLVWLEAMALIDARDIWLRNAEGIRQRVLRMKAEDFGSLSHLRLLKFIYSPRFKQPPFQDDFNREEFAWSMFRAELLKNKANLASLANSLSDDIPPPRPSTAVLGKFWAIGGGLLAVLGCLLFYQEWRKHQKEVANLDVDDFNKDQFELKQFHSRKRDVRLVIELNRIEWKLGLSPLQAQFTFNPKWSKLSSNQSLLLHLLYRGHSVDECAEFLGLSRGHVYNQRSKIRSILALTDQDDLINHLQRSVTPEPN